MLKKTITYKDYDEKSVTEDFYFNLTKAELLEFVIARGAGFETYLNQITATDDMKQILPVFKEIISMTIGKKDPITNRFVKNEVISGEFMASEAYSELFFEFMTDVNAFVLFIQGVMPKELAEQVDFATGELKSQQTAVSSAESRLSETIFGDREAGDYATSKKVQVIPLPKGPLSEDQFNQYTDAELMAIVQGDAVEAPKEKTFDDYTKGELMAMSQEQFDKLTTGDPRKMTRPMLIVASQRRTRKV